jgi:glycosyltransferase involved in cell wall biosynthesis
MSPAVTLGLVAYNQEKYVREAIDAAFAQMFSPLEIILSDDCSPDQTFAIMEEMAAAYRGPHSVRTRREPSNVGLVQHLMNVARAAQGDLLVVAAGDDISYPNRAGALYQAWTERGAAALTSLHDEIDAKGTVLGRGLSFPHSDFTQKMFADDHQAHRVDGMVEIVPGFCAAYPRSFWADLPDAPCSLQVEDGIASALINMRRGRIHRVQQSLVAYRILDESLTVRKGGLTFDEIRDREGKIDRHARELLPQANYTINQAMREGIKINPRTLTCLNAGRNHGEVVAGFWQARPIARLLRLAKVRTAYDAKFLIPRLFGFRVFAILRSWMHRGV